MDKGVAGERANFNGNLTIVPPNNFSERNVFMQSPVGCKGPGGDGKGSCEESDERMAAERQAGESLGGERLNGEAVAKENGECVAGKKTGERGAAAVEMFLDAAVGFLQADRGMRVADCRVRQCLMDSSYRLGFTPHRLHGVGSRYEGMPGKVCGDANTLNTSRDLPVVVCEPVSAHIRELRHNFGYVTAVPAEGIPCYARLRADRDDMPRFVRTPHEGHVYLNSHAFAQRSSRARHASGDFALHSHVERNTANCLVCPIWPPCAAGFLARPRPSGWPDRALLDKLQHAGCHLVAEGDMSSKERDIEWRWCFSVAEKELVHQLPDPLAGVLLVLKAVTNQLGGKFSRVAFPDPYCVKTACLWVFEAQGLAAAGGYSSCFRLSAAVIGWLEKAFGEHRLPHYFIPEHNLISQLSAEEAADVRAHLAAIHADLHRVILDSLDVTSFLPGLVRDVATSLQEAPKSAEALVAHLLSSDPRMAEVLGMGVIHLGPGGAAYRLHRRLAFGLWSDGYFHNEMFDVLFGQLERGAPLADVITVPELVIKPILADLKARGEVGALYRQILHRFLGDLFHNFCFLLAEREESGADEGGSAMRERCFDTAVRYYRLGLSVRYPDGWEDGGLGGQVLLAKHYFLLERWELLAGAQDALQPMLDAATAAGTEQSLNSCPKINIWKNVDAANHFLTDVFCGGAIASACRDNFIPVHPAPLGYYLLFLRERTRGRQDAAAGALDRLRGCGPMLWDEASVATTKMLTEHAMQMTVVTGEM